MTGTRRVKNLWVCILIASVISSVFILWGRGQIEKTNNTVELVIDYKAAGALCRTAGYPLDNFLKEARDRGLTSAALSERTIRDITTEGQVHLFSGRQILDYNRLSPVNDDTLRRMIEESRIFAGNSYIFPRDDMVFQNLIETLPVRLGGERISTFSSENLGLFLETARDVLDLEKVNIGLDPNEARNLVEAGLNIVPRLRNYSGINSYKIGYSFSRIPYRDNAGLMIFEGMEILGYPDHLDDVYELMSLNNMNFGHIEFTSQTGDDLFARLMGDKVVRVHSITEREMDKISFDKAVERFVRAARERNIRVMYIRPFQALTGDTEIVGKNLDYIQAIKDGLLSSGFSIGQAKPIPRHIPGKYLVAMTGIGILAAAFILLDTLFSLPPVIELGLFALGSIIYVALLFTGYSTFIRQIAALGGAVVFPVLAVSTLYIKSLLKCGAYRTRQLKDALLLWLEASGISVVGGLLVAGTLSSGSFMLAIDKFIGVKAAHVIPVFLGAVICWKHLIERKQLGRNGIRNFFVELQRLFMAPLRVWHLLVLIVIALGGLVYVLRTGNFYLGLPIPQFDEGMRRFLEGLLVFRPRTKEFLIGHPLLLLAVPIALSGYSKFSLLLVAIGCIGQISMINTFSHIHTPIMVTVQRTFYGLVLGAIIGIVATVIFIYFLRNNKADQVISEGEQIGK